jgi:protein-S-isoprenylcysteine O-methyltransferase Ste14
VRSWFITVAVTALIVLQFVVRVPFAMRAEKAPVATSRRGPLEIALMALVTLGYLVLPILAIATPFLSFADYAPNPIAFAAGLAAAALGLWLCYRSHADLGDNWSVTLELKESHRLVTTGVYGRVRHPMYTALLLIAVAQALLLPNWLAGPAYLVAFALLVALRVGPEERMMRDRFKNEYDEYATRTKRLVPGVL